MPTMVERVSGYPVVLQGVLNRLQHAVKVEIEDYDGEEEWFQVWNDDLEDSDVYNRLKLHWGHIAGVHSKSFALLHCQGGPYSGVWIHFFDEGPEEYAPGCHRLAAW